MTVWLKLSEKDLQLSAVFVVTVFFQGKRSRRDLKFSTAGPIRSGGQACLSRGPGPDKVPLELAIHPAENMGQTDWSFSDQALRQHGILRDVDVLRESSGYFPAPEVPRSSSRASPRP